LAGATTNDYQALKTVYFNLGFSNLMLIVIAAVAVGAVRFSMTMGESRTLPRDFDQIDAVIETSRQDVQRYTELEKLPKLGDLLEKGYCIF
jgi:hypothetical protein